MTKKPAIQHGRRNSLKTSRTKGAAGKGCGRCCCRATPTGRSSKTHTGIVILAVCSSNSSSNHHRHGCPRRLVGRARLRKQKLLAGNTLPTTTHKEKIQNCHGK
mmetsp:Transcript_29198/g.60674  ORF Transcript_29198/g.60674 Transcript_29198/m.60674 type:complete len:104 (+) Transcript_29198:614-925(+)